MKAFAKGTKTFLVMQSQTNRFKAGIGDVELDKDAAYGTSAFEWYCDYVVTTWQPLKRVYDLMTSMPSPLTVTCFKYCKIRRKNVKLDDMKEDAVHGMYFDVDTEMLREMTEAEYKAFMHWSKQAAVLRKRNKHHEPAPLKKMDWLSEGKNEQGPDQKTTLPNRKASQAKAPGMPTNGKSNAPRRKDFGPTSRAGRLLRTV
jgi:hypothetical protein